VRMGGDSAVDSVGGRESSREARRIHDEEAVRTRADRKNVAKADVALVRA
jgi:hypothetical protein